MNDPNFEKGMSKALSLCLDGIADGKYPNDPSAGVRLGAIQLADGREAEIQLFVTADRDLFIGCLDENGLPANALRSAPANE